MTEGKQSNNTKKKVPHILVVQDIDNTTAATYDTSFNVEQHKKTIKSLRGGREYFGVFHDSLLYIAML